MVFLAQAAEPVLIPSEPSLLDSIIYLLGGITLVLIILAMLWLLVSLIGRAFKKQDAPRPAPAPAAAGATEAAAAAEAPAAGSDEPTPQEVAVIAAAVHATLGGAFRILSITPAAHPLSPNLQAWSAEGRRQIFSSHRIR